MKVLITAGAVYGRLDDNKIVSNRTRGIWALLYAQHLLERGDDVTVIVPDVMDKERLKDFGGTVVKHSGFDDYMEKCLALAPKVDAAVMAAAVVNWIPAEPIKGKMPTDPWREGDVISVPFKLAPRVIERMKAANPDLTLIGCKMLSDAPHKDLLDAAGHVCHKARCNAVVANDLKRGLRTKYVVMPDLSVHAFDYEFDRFYAFLDGILDDVHYRTSFFDVPMFHPPTKNNRDAREHLAEARRRFDKIVAENRSGFTPGGDGKVFGSLAVRVLGMFWLVSPREKGEEFTSKDAVLVMADPRDHNRIVHVADDGTRRKATLNATLLTRAGDSCGAAAVLHQHNRLLPDAPLVPYAPPGTVRDNEREIPGPAFNIDRHGFVKCLKEKDLIL